MINTSTYCSLATSGWDSRTKKMCCWAKLPEYKNYRQMHSDTTVNKLVQDLQNGIQNPICSACWKMESVNTKSMRQQFLETKNKLKIDNETQNKKIRHLVVDTGNQCNFACRTCGPWSSTGHFKEWESKNNHKFNNNQIVGTDMSLINEDLSHVQSIEVLGGEPFVNTEHLSIIEKITTLPTAKECSLSYTTNGSVKLRPTISNLFKKFKSVNISLSIDAVGKPFEYIRTLGKWTQVKDNITFLTNLKKEIKTLSLSAHPTISALNIFYLQELFDYFDGLDLNYTLVYCEHPKHYSMSIFNEAQKNQIITKLKKIKQYHAAEQIIKHIEQSKFDGESKKSFAEFTDFTKKFRKLDIKDYLPTLVGVMNS